MRSATIAEPWTESTGQKHRQQSRLSRKRMDSWQTVSSDRRHGASCSDYLNNSNNRASERKNSGAIFLNFFLKTIDIVLNEHYNVIKIKNGGKYNERDMGNKI